MLEPKRIRTSCKVKKTMLELIVIDKSQICRNKPETRANLEGKWQQCVRLSSQSCTGFEDMDIASFAQKYLGCHSTKYSTLFSSVTAVGAGCVATRRDGVASCSVWSQTSKTLCNRVDVVSRIFLGRHAPLCRHALLGRHALLLKKRVVQQLFVVGTNCGILLQAATKPTWVTKQSASNN